MKKIVLLLFILITVGFTVVILLSPSSQKAMVGGMILSAEESVLAQAHNSVGQVTNDDVHNMALAKTVNNAENNEIEEIVALTGVLRSGLENEMRVGYQFADDWSRLRVNDETRIANVIQSAKRVDAVPSLTSVLLAADIEKLKPANNSNMVNCGEQWATASKIPKMKTIERNEEKATLLAAHIFRSCLA